MPLRWGRSLADAGMTARQVTAPCPGRPGAAPAQARSAGRRPGVRGAETWPCGWDRREADRLARCRPATPGAQRGLSLCAPERSAPPGRGRRSRAMRSVAGQGRKSWRKLRAAPLPRRPCPAGKGGGTALASRAAGTGAGVAATRVGGGRWRRGRGARGSLWSRSAGAGTASCLRLLVLWLWLPGLEARPSPAAAGTAST